MGVGTGLGGAGRQGTKLAGLCGSGCAGWGCWGQGGSGLRGRVLIAWGRSVSSPGPQSSSHCSLSC